MMFNVTESCTFLEVFGGDQFCFWQRGLSEGEMVGRLKILSSCEGTPDSKKELFTSNASRYIKNSCSGYTNVRTGLTGRRGEGSGAREGYKSGEGG